VRTSELVSASLRGDGRAFAGLAAEHAARARATAFAVLGDWHEAEDAAQEALLRAYLTLERLREPAAFGAWLAGIALNVARSRARRHDWMPRDGGARRGRSRPGDWLALEEISGGRSPAGAPPSPHDALELAELRAAVAAGLAELPPQHAEVLRMHYADDLPVRAIARALGRSEGAVRVRLHRARAALRERLGALAPVATNREGSVAMVDVVVEDVLARGAEEMRVVLLREAGGERLLPIWIGPADAYGLAFALAGEPAPRPLPGDLMAALVVALRARVERVAVARLEGDTFHASVHVGSHVLDARPSDALALALRVGAPIQAAADVLDRAAVTRARLPAHLAEHAEEWRPLSASLALELQRPHWSGSASKP
jgi:RNA polymerase sigma factor (sigma-70 family)